MINILNWGFFMMFIIMNNPNKCYSVTHWAILPFRDFQIRLTVVNSINEIRDLNHLSTFAAKIRHMSRNFPILATAVKVLESSREISSERDPWRVKLRH